MVAGVLYLDVMRRRGNQYHEHMAEKAPHVLSFTGESLSPTAASSSAR